MNTITPVKPPANGNTGIVPPWLQHPPIGIYPMPEPPKESK